MDYKKMVLEKVKAIKTEDELKAERAKRVDAMLATAWAPIIEVFDSIKDMDVLNFRCQCRNVIKAESAFSLGRMGGQYYSRKLEAWNSMGNTAWKIYPEYDATYDCVNFRKEEHGQVRTVNELEVIERLTTHVAKLATGRGV